MAKSSWIKPLFFLLAFVVFSALIGWYFQLDKRQRIHIYLTQKIAKLRSEFRATKHTYDKLSNFLYDELAEDSYFLKILAKAIEDPGRREMLYRYLLPRFSILRRYSINYLSIYTPEGKVLLNMHKPTKKSTPLKRPLFAQPKVNELLMEYKKPLYYNGRLLAFLQTAISYNVLKQELQRLFSGYYEYIVKRSLIGKSIFSYGSHLFIQSDLSPDYFYEESSIEQNGAKKAELIHTIDLAIKDKIARQLSRGHSFAIVTKVEGKYYTVTFLAIKKQGTIGYLISYKQDPTISTFDTIFWQNLILGNVTLLIILAFIYYVLETRSRFEKMAITDKLTGLYNRYKFYQVANQEFNRAKRHNRPLSLILFDIDWFKKINDTYGHDVGDLVLRRIAKLLRTNLRKYDLVFRWGGEEFIILAPETDAKGAMRIAEKIRTLIASHAFEGAGNVTVSLGVAELTPQDKEVDAIIKRADNALYISKKEGRNRATLSL